MPTYVALLRGINVGSTRSLKMSMLREIIAGIGAEHVATYIQSGNAVFSHAGRSAAGLEAQLERALLTETGMVIPVVLRTQREWTEMVEGNPFPSAAGARLHVLFSKAPLSRKDFSALDLESLLPEELAIGKRHLYMHLPNGMGKSKLAIEIGRRGPKQMVGTVRNWNTVVELHRMTTIK